MPLGEMLGHKGKRIPGQLVRAGRGVRLRQPERGSAANTQAQPSHQHRLGSPRE